MAGRSSARCRLAAIGAAAAGLLVERTIFRRLYWGNQLDQVLLTIGIVTMTVAGATFIWGAVPPAVHVPSFLEGRVHFGWFDIGSYRLFLIVFGGVIDIGASAWPRHTPVSAPRSAPLSTIVA